MRAPRALNPTARRRPDSLETFANIPLARPDRIVRVKQRHRDGTVIA